MDKMFMNSRDAVRYIENLKELWTPPTTYKDIQPMPEMFHFKESQINLIEDEYHTYLFKDEKLKSFLVFIDWILFMLLLILGIGAPFFLIYGIIGLCTNNKECTQYIIMGIVGAAYLVFYFWYIKKTKTYREAGHYQLEFGKDVHILKRGYRDIFKHFQDYKDAVWQYEWWQKFKERDHWIAMNGRQFEIAIGQLFQRAGYNVDLCKQGGDGGADLLLTKNGTVSCVQCKAHNSKISPSVARDLYGTMNDMNIAQGYLVTLHGGTQGTIDFCQRTKIVLWDINDILSFQKAL